jgi:uncharacterized membrane protein
MLMSESDDNMLLYLLAIPAVIIVAMIIAVIVCVVAKKKAVAESQKFHSASFSEHGGSTMGTMQLGALSEPTSTASGTSTF